MSFLQAPTNPLPGACGLPAKSLSDFQNLSDPAFRTLQTLNIYKYVFLKL